MNPVVKALIEKLKQKQEATANDASSPPCRSIQLTPEQEALAIPPYLVYLAGLLSFGERNLDYSSALGAPPYPKIQRERFQALQAAYHDCAIKNNDATSAAPRFYSVSPRIVPTEAQKKFIEEDIDIMVKQLEANADAIIQGLQNDDIQVPTVRRNHPKKKNKKPTPSRQAPHTASSNATLGGNVVETEDNSPEKTLEELQREIQRKNASMHSGGDNGGAWITVSKKAPKTTTALETKDTAEEEEAMSPRSAELLETTTSDSFDFIVDPMEPSTDVDECQQEANTMMKSRLGPATDAKLLHSDSTTNVLENNKPLVAATTTTTTTGANTESLELRIRLLEQQLAEKINELARERKDHARALRAEKERSDDLLQSLQLRLYISETRLKTYQEALDQHVQAVAANTAPSSSQVVGVTSPMRKAGDRHDHPPPSSPLISRVLQQQNRLED